MSNNPLANVLRFGFTPLGSPSIPSAPGTSYLHPDQRFIVLSLTKPYIRFGRSVFGAASSSGLGYLHQDQRFMLVGLTKQYIRFGRLPFGSGGVTPPSVGKNLGLYTANGGYFICMTDGNGNLVPTHTYKTLNLKQLPGLYAPDGSYYVTLTDGNGNLL